MTASDSSAPVTESRKVRAWLTVLGAAFVAAFFLFFTWRGMLVYFTGDDLMNLYNYWIQPVSQLVKENFFFWTPSTRPFGAVIYRPLFAIFGFNPYPEYVLYFAAMLANLWLCYRVFARLSGSREIGAIGTLLWAFHGKFGYLYYNGGSLYDVYCFLFVFSALAIYLRARAEGRLPGVWATIAILLLLICGLNMKEMAVALPVMILIYELLWHPPAFRTPDLSKLRALLRWCLGEGRTALAGALCVLMYIPARLGSKGIAQNDAYVPVYTLGRWLEDTGTFLGYLLYRNNPHSDLNVSPLSPLGIVIFYAVLLGIALWLRSRLAIFGLLFFAIGSLPVSFIPPRLGYVLYMPLAGLALFGAVCLVRFQQALGRLIGEALGNRAASSPTSVPWSAIGLFLATALVIGAVDFRNWEQAPDPKYSPYKDTIAQMSRLYPTFPHGAKLLFVHSALDNNWDLFFLLRMYYRDEDLFLTVMRGPEAQRIPFNKMPHYDHIFDYIGGHYVELDNSDAILSVKFHMLKTANPDYSFGETMLIGRPGATQYVVKGVLLGDAKAQGFWTLDEPVLQFRLSAVQHHIFREHFYIPLETFQQTGPLIVDFYVNGHHLDQARFEKDGDLVYEHEVPERWLTTQEVTKVEMKVHNPYVSPRDGVKLGVLLKSAGFSAVPINL